MGQCIAQALLDGFHAGSQRCQIAHIFFFLIQRRCKVAVCHLLQMHTGIFDYIVEHRDHRLGRLCQNAGFVAAFDIGYRRTQVALSELLNTLAAQTDGRSDFTGYHPSNCRRNNQRNYNQHNGHSDCYISAAHKIAYRRNHVDAPAICSFNGSIGSHFLMTIQRVSSNTRFTGTHFCMDCCQTCIIGVSFGLFFNVLYANIFHNGVCNGDAVLVNHICTTVITNF